MKKKLFLLASVAMGVALIGGTFASWAVTDNADPFSIKVSTGEVSTDGAEYVTLSWGDQQNMSNVANLALNTVRKAGVLDLRADTASANNPDGKLHFTLDGGSHLLAGLELKVYEGNLAATNNIIEAATIAAATEVSFTDGVATIGVTKNAANLFTVAVNLKSSVDAAALDEMTGEQVTVTFDWGKGTDVLEAVTLFATGFGGDTPYVYAWNGTSQNASFPGVEMTPVTGAPDYFTAQVNTSFTKVIFTNASETKKSGDIVIATSFSGGKNLFEFDSTVETIHGTFDTFHPEDVKEPAYYVVGSFTGDGPEYWGIDEDFLMVQDSLVATTYELKNVSLPAGAKFKVHEPVVAKQWYSDATTWDYCGFTIDEEGNIVVTAAGVYDIGFNLADTSGNYVYLSSNTYNVVGTFNEWTASNANKMTIDSGDANHFTLTGVVLTAGAKLKVKSIFEKYITNAETWQDCGFTLEEGTGNIIVTAAGTYTIDYYVVDQYALGHHVILTKTA